MAIDKNGFYSIRRYLPSFHIVAGDGRVVQVVVVLVMYPTVMPEVISGSDECGRQYDRSEARRPKHIRHK